MAVRGRRSAAVALGMRDVDEVVAAADVIEVGDERVEGRIEGKMLGRREGRLENCLGGDVLVRRTWYRR